MSFAKKQNVIFRIPSASFDTNLFPFSILVTYLYKITSHLPPHISLCLFYHHSFQNFLQLQLINKVFMKTKTTLRKSVFFNTSLFFPSLCHIFLSIRRSVIFPRTFPTVSFIFSSQNFIFSSQNHL